jgi:hypothetical protein
MDNSGIEKIAQLSANGYISFNSAEKIALDFNLSPWETEKLILAAGFIPLKYKKNNLNLNDQKRAFNSKILIA